MKETEFYDCPICGSSFTTRTEESGGYIYRCNNTYCASNGGGNCSAWNKTENNPYAFYVFNHVYEIEKMMKELEKTIDEYNAGRITMNDLQHVSALTTYQNLGRTIRVLRGVLE